MGQFHPLCWALSEIFSLSKFKPFISGKLSAMLPLIIFFHHALNIFFFPSASLLFEMPKENLILKPLDWPSNFLVFSPCLLSHFFFAPFFQDFLNFIFQYFYCIFHFYSAIVSIFWLFSGIIESIFFIIICMDSVSSYLFENYNSSFIFFPQYSFLLSSLSFLCCPHLDS